MYFMLAYGACWLTLMLIGRRVAVALLWHGTETEDR
jgi:hypothetical protein